MMERNRILGMTCGYYLSRFDGEAYRRLGFGTQQATHEEIASRLDVPPNSIKNWRDEFDPLHNNARKGWHGRPMLRSRERAHDALAGLTERALLDVILEILSAPGSTALDELVHALQNPEGSVDAPVGFAPRAPTGRAAEEAFKHHHEHVGEPVAGTLVDRRDDGCGYDFLIRSPDGEVAVEVKGLAGDTGGATFTDKEWNTARALGDSYYLALVRNAQSQPEVILVQNPAANLDAQMRTTTSIQVSWSVPAGALLR